MALATNRGPLAAFADYDRLVASYKLSVSLCRLSLGEFRSARRELIDVNKEWRQTLVRLLDDPRMDRNNKSNVPNNRSATSADWRLLGN